MTHEHARFIDEEALVRGLAKRPEPMPAAALAPLVSELCQWYRTLKIDQAWQPALYQPSGEWHEYIRRRGHLYRAWQDGDIPNTTQQLQNFWRTELAIVQQYAGYHALLEHGDIRAHFVDQMAYDFMVWSHLFRAEPRELEIPLVGNPWGYYVDNVLVAPKALRYHVLSTQITHLTCDISRPVIAEIGAGYGGTAYYLLRGNRPITYIDFDLPEILMICAYYLKRSLPHRRFLLYKPGLHLDGDMIAKYDVILLPNWMIKNIEDRTVDVFYNTFSLSEMHLDIIREYFKHIERCCRGYFLHNNMDRPGVFQYGYERVPCSQYPISPEKFKLLYRRYDLFQRRHFGRDGDYREELYERIRS